jgi:hypothetical protein
VCFERSAIWLLPNKTKPNQTNRDSIFWMEVGSRRLRCQIFSTRVCDNCNPQPSAIIRHAANTQSYSRRGKEVKSVLYDSSRGFEPKSNLTMTSFAPLSIHLLPRLLEKVESWVKVKKRFLLFEKMTSLKRNAPPTHPHAPISRSTHTRTHSTHAHTHAKVKDAATVVPSPLLLHARVSSRRVPRYGSAPFLFHRCQKNNYHEKRITSKTQMQTFHHEVDTMVRGEKPCERKKNNARAYLLHVQRLPCLPHTHTPKNHIPPFEKNNKHSMLLPNKL